MNNTIDTYAQYLRCCLDDSGMAPDAAAKIESNYRQLAKEKPAVAIVAVNAALTKHPADRKAGLKVINDTLTRIKKP